MREICYEVSVSVLISINSLDSLIRGKLELA